MGRRVPRPVLRGPGGAIPPGYSTRGVLREPEDAHRVKDYLLPPWLAERGLTLSEEKTRIVHLTEGFDFLGCTVKHYHAPQTSRSGYKLLIKPSKKAVTRKQQELRDVWLGLKGQDVDAVLSRLNPIIRGWANYYRPVVASEVLSEMDNWMHYRAVRYTKHTHPTKPQKWIYDRYWGVLNPDAEGPLGVWRQAHRALPAEVRLVQDRQAHTGTRHGLTG